MQFYVVFPLLFLMMRSWGGVVVVLSLSIATYFVGRSFEQLYLAPSFLPLKLAPFLAGMLVAWASENRRSAATHVWLLGVLVLVSSLQASRWGGQWLLFPILASMFFALSCNQTSFGWTARARGLLGCRFAEWLSDMSYGVYLIHGFFIALTAYLLDKNFLNNLSGTARTILLLVIAVPGAYASASIVSKLVERPGIELGRWLTGRIAASPPRARARRGIITDFDVHSMYRRLRARVIPTP